MKDLLLYHRLIDKVVLDPVSKCWLWTGSKNRDGYGVIGHNCRHDMAHRAMWMAKFGPIEGGLVVRHSCDVRNCINPKHLSLGTRGDNMQDTIDRARTNGGGRRRRIAPVTDEVAVPGMAEWVLQARNALTG